jgi:hypothetical protein
LGFTVVLLVTASLGLTKLRSLHLVWGTCSEKRHPCKLNKVLEVKTRGAADPHLPDQSRRDNKAAQHIIPYGRLVNLGVRQ